MKFLFIFLILLSPFLTFAQFTGFQDETLGVPVWSGDSSYIGGADTQITNDNQRFGKEGSFSNSGALNSPNVINCSIQEKTIKGYVDYLGCETQRVVLPFIIAIALVAFVWGVTVIVRDPASEESQKKGRIFILWGIIGFFVITSVYALIAILRRTVGFGSNFGGRGNSGTPYTQLKEKVQKLK